MDTILNLTTFRGANVQTFDDAVGVVTQVFDALIASGQATMPGHRWTFIFRSNGCFDQFTNLDVAKTFEMDGQDWAVIDDLYEKLLDQLIVGRSDIRYVVRVFQSETDTDIGGYVVA